MAFNSRSTSNVWWVKKPSSSACITTQTSELYSIDDSLKGETRYQYDPIGRLKAASTPLGNETFAFDPAGNLIAPELLQSTEQHRDS